MGQDFFPKKLEREDQDMSEFSRFMKANKMVKENEKHIVTESLRDENGKPLEWEFRHISSKENEEIREQCTIDVPVTGKPNVYRPRLKSAEYIRKMIAASIEYPDLYDAQLQDSYGVKTPEDLLLEMVDDPGEYNMLAEYVQKFQGFQSSFQEKVDEAKN
ncbi:hypothetical protein C806_00124 [Lachnospiraceae bacterium 3-1]|nr:hypothetical protein C806_00124 [Lachnospiraceae bacterium 3-1]